MQHFLENYPILYFDEVDSTNNVLRQKVKEQICYPPFAIAAGYQTAGRGQRQNRWQSVADKNILCSFLVQGFKINQLPHINNAAATAIRETLSAFDIVNANVKWPNDIFVFDNKIAGVLIENVIAGTELKYCIVGVGINVNQTNDLLPTATSMAATSGSQYPINDVLIYLFQSFYSQLKKETTQLLAELNMHIYKRDEPVTFLTEKGSSIYTVQSILKNGNLLVSDNSNYVELEHHKVKWQL